MAMNGTQNVKITLHWLNMSCAQRIVWLLEELKLEYDIKPYKRTKEMLAPPELKQIHPLGKSPVLELQTPEMEKPLILAESGAIIEYLTDHFGTGLIPKRYVEGKEGWVGGESESWHRYRYYMHFVEGSLMKMLTVALIFQGVKTAPAPFFIKPLIRLIVGKVESLYIEPNMKTHFGYLEQQIASAPDEGEFLCGKDIAPADFMILFVLQVAQAKFGLTADKFPKLCAYMGRLEAREAYKRGVERTKAIEAKE